MGQPWLKPASRREASAWDVCWVGGVLVPGIVTVETTCSRDLDVKKTKGKDKATMTDNGYNPATVKITSRIRDAEQWEAYQVFQDGVHPRNAGGIREPLEILHPEPNAKQVTQIYVKTIDPYRVTLGTEIAITLQCVEWSPAPKPVKKASGSGSNTARGTPPTNKEPLTPLQESLSAYNANAQPAEVNDAVDDMFSDMLYGPSPEDL